MALLGGGLLAGMLAVSYLGERTRTHGRLRSWCRWPSRLSRCGCSSVTSATRRTPFIAPRLITGPGFGAVNLVNALYGGVTSGVVALVPLYATNRYGIERARLRHTARSPKAPPRSYCRSRPRWRLRRTGYRPPLYVGGVVIATGMLLLALSPVAGIPPYAWLAGSAFLVGVGRGTINPASRNAGLQLAPEHSSTLAALRTMCMQIGSIITISIATAILASSDDPGRIQAWLFAATAALLVVALPLITRVPEHHGSW